MKLTKNEIMHILNGGGEMKVALSHAEKLEVVRRFELHGMIEEPKFAIAIPDEENQDGYATYDRRHGWLSGYDKHEIVEDKSFHFTMEEIEAHAVLSKLKVFLMEV